MAATSVRAMAATAVAATVVVATVAKTLPMNALAGWSTRTDKATEMADDVSHASTCECGHASTNTAGCPMR